MKQWMEQIGKSRRLVIAILAAGLLLAALFLVPKLFGKEQTPEIFTTSALQRIIKVSELSTLSSVYNGIAQVPSPKNPQEVGYYVSYRAQVKAGIAFDAVEVLLDETERVITVKIPPAAITEVNVDISSLDYIFLDESCNTSSVSAEAYLACEQDARAESEARQTIYELAAQNARNSLTALIRPLIDQLGGEYTLVVL